MEPDDYAHLHYEQKNELGQRVQVRFNGTLYAYEYNTLNTGPTIGSLNCPSDPPPGDGFADDIIMAKDTGDGSTNLNRYLFNGANNVTTSSPSISLNPNRVGDRMVVADFDNDRVDEVGFIVEQNDGSWMLQVWEPNGTYKGEWYDPTGPYTLSLNDGRLATGDFDGQ